MVNPKTTASGAGLREKLADTMALGTGRLLDDPYYRGLADGSPPGRALAHCTLQDLHHLLPNYGRAHARCAALAPDHRHAPMFSRTTTSLRYCAVRAEGFARAASRLSVPLDQDATEPPIAPATLLRKGPA
ncbi:hypothetical protein AAW14_27515 [Streptomyces hygroscopicus]|uniref:hypothetical protein n=1 Tax=Streptomyces hygroscopicus TaxID=1912 RepID=UPI00223F2AF1|nr:hypothetical protein [Streptomyces hygroscopicus]MCW7945654.1 hypothetical protein [Streptomyces hygroscopicus]